MIELVIAACLATGECRDFSLLYDPHEVSLMTCMIAGQPEVARWTVMRWSCDLQDTRSAEL